MDFGPRLQHYETHITLAATDQSVLELIRAWAEAQGMKWTQIVLDVGVTPLQPMITFWERESILVQRQRVESIVQAVKQLGGTVVRVKIEVALDDDSAALADAGLSADAGLPADSTTYFEHHVKVLLADHSDLTALSQHAAQHAARLSHNARRRRADGRMERFVTQRVYDRDRLNAKSRLEQLLKTLNDAAFEIIEVEAEYVVFDSNLAVDSGWLEPAGGGSHGAI